MIIDSDTFYSTDILIVDIDDTLIYGRFVEFMDLTWRIFKSKTLAKFLAKIQTKFKLYKVNYKVAELIVQFLINMKRVKILTARSYDKSIIKLVQDIIPTYGFISVHCLGSENPSRDKFEWIQYNFNDDEEKILLIDDNLRTRLKCMELPHVQAVHPGDIING